MLTFLDPGTKVTQLLGHTVIKQKFILNWHLRQQQQETKQYFTNKYRKIRKNYYKHDFYEECTNTRGKKL